jgi:lysophospholipase L1-like esterase
MRQNLALRWRLSVNFEKGNSMSRKTLIFSLLNSLVWALIIGPATAQSGPNTESNNGGYLALGDSLPFGYNPLVQPPDLSHYFGYPSIISAISEKSLTNASCPFETTGTFLSGRTTADGLFGCPIWRAASGLTNPLFVSYSGSQLVYATTFLQSHPNIRLVTIQLGGNDLADLAFSCQGVPACELPRLPATLAQVASNLGMIIAHVRGAGYSGPIVLVNYYAFNYTNLVQTGAFSALAATIAMVAAASPDVKVADAFKAFALVSAPFAGDTCAAGLRIKLKSLDPQTGDTCDVHPTFAGHAVLAAAVFTALAK